ncbi:MAG TPA: alginate lyase family protein [Flavipsychrobacter sp.]|nr:alginate lyase family protein [Flavipsychrobacter sp.]
MLQKLKNAVNLISNMGWRYVSFRGKHELARRSGLLKAKFPVNPSAKALPGLAQWKSSSAKFFFQDKSTVQIPRIPSEQLKERFKNFKAGKLLLFNSNWADLGSNYDWVTNPDTNYQYNAHQHWTEIADYSKEAGDIKYVWEKSRFSFLYDIIRYDYHFGQDCAELVMSEILSWIEHNPINCGPNWRCSQEISLRVLNWTFALFYYRESEQLTEAKFSTILQSIYWQIHHVYNNINFSRIAVRNNHAITETLALYLSNLLFPGIADFQKWSIAGKQWFEQEIAYQIYEDGTFLQFSMNYHRVVVQLLTWAVRLSELNNDPFASVVYDRAAKSLKFLRVCMDNASGWLPNYGANDGALFFKLNDCHYRDYRPQLQALASVLSVDALLDNQEDSGWYGTADIPGKSSLHLSANCYSFDEGGYYIMRENEMLTFIRCGSYKDRPSQADNLHVDIWYKGENILFDAGSYKYNTDDDTLRYFMGTASHNTVMINGQDQMKKGGRFIWYYWPKKLYALLVETDRTIDFKGAMNMFRHHKKDIVHHRSVTKSKQWAGWTIVDNFEHLPKDSTVEQLWHFPMVHCSDLKLEVFDAVGNIVEPLETGGWTSSLYGTKEAAKQISFSTSTNRLVTILKIKQ